MDNMDDIAVRVSHVSKSFKLPHDKSNSIKSKLINFRKRGYELQEALRDISFDVKKGEFFGIVGKNGSGKSTLLKMLAGIYSPNSGSIQINGRLTPFIELGVGFNPELSGRDNVFLNGALLGFTRNQMAEMYEEIVAFAEIERFMDQKLKNYSSGMQVRLAFSIAIRANTDILVLDEVLAVGDAAFQQKCFEYFENIKRQKKTIIFVTHDMDSVRRFCDRAIFIENGQIKLTGSPTDVSDVYLESNIRQDETKQDDGGDLSVKLLSKNKLKPGDPLRMEITYTLDEEKDHYIGLSLQSNGVSFGEQNTKKALAISSKVGKKSVTVELGTNMMNGGQYDIGVAVFEKSSSGLMYFKTRATSFVITGKDDTVAGPMRLATVWTEDE